MQYAGHFLMSFQGFGSLGGIEEPRVNIPVWSFAQMCSHRSLTGKGHRRNIAAVRIVLRSLAPTFGDPQQVERGPHVHLMVNHGIKPRPRSFPLEISFFPALDRLGPELKIHHGSTGTKTHVQRTEVVV